MPLSTSENDLALSASSLKSQQDSFAEPLAAHLIAAGMVTASVAMAVAASQADVPAPPIMDRSQLIMAPADQPAPAQQFAVVLRPVTPPRLTIKPDAIAALGRATPATDTPGGSLFSFTDDEVVELISRSTTALTAVEPRNSQLRVFDEEKQQQIKEEKQGIEFGRKPKNLEQQIAAAINTNLFSPRNRMSAQDTQAPAVSAGFRDALAAAEGELLEAENGEPQETAYFASRVPATFTRGLKVKSEAAAAQKLADASANDRKDRRDQKLKYNG